MRNQRELFDWCASRHFKRTMPHLRIPRRAQIGLVRFARLCAATKRVRATTKVVVW